MTLDLAALRATIAARGECTGPMTTFNHGADGKSAHVSIICRDNWGKVIDWLDAMVNKVPALLDRCERAEAEVARLTVNHDHSCTCPHGDAREPLVNHDKACPIRVNKLKRIAPEVALSRLAAALDTGDELDEVTADRDALRSQLERAEADAKQRGFNDLHAMVPEPRGADIWTKVDALIRERDALRAECERLRPVYEAAREWRDDKWPAGSVEHAPVERALTAAINTARKEQGK